MKQNSKKILLWLYGVSGRTQGTANLAELQGLWPDLKPSSLRSLLQLLKQQSLVGVEKADGQTRYHLSSYGRDLLEDQFPALKDESPSMVASWQLVTFIEAPSNDKQFRYLRQYLTSQRFGALSRGNYLYPGELPDQVKKTLNKLYIGGVVVTGFTKWSFGDERLIVDRVFGLSDLKSGYSGISKEVDRLLVRKNQPKSIEHKDKLAIGMVFDRLESFLSLDLGLFPFYYPELVSGKGLLLALAQLYEE